MAENIIKDVKLKIGTETQFQSKLKDLPINTLVGTTDPIQEGELDTSIITKLNKAENALPKPTNDTTGSAGQVLKKTANGSEWGDAPSDGGKLYRHNMYFFSGPPEGYRITVYTSNATPYTPETFFADFNNRNLYCCGTVETGGKKYPICNTVFTDTYKRIYYITSDGSEAMKEINVSQLSGNDVVYEV